MSLGMHTAADVPPGARILVSRAQGSDVHTVRIYEHGTPGDSISLFFASAKDLARLRDRINACLDQRPDGQPAAARPTSGGAW